MKMYTKIILIFLAVLNIKVLKWNYPIDNQCNDILKENIGMKIMEEEKTMLSSVKLPLIRKVFGKLSPQIIKPYIKDHWFHRLLGRIHFIRSFAVTQYLYTVCGIDRLSRESYLKILALNADLRRAMNLTGLAYQNYIRFSQVFSILIFVICMACICYQLLETYNWPVFTKKPKMPSEMNPQPGFRQKLNTDMRLHKICEYSPEDVVQVKSLYWNDVQLLYQNVVCVLGKGSYGKVYKIRYNEGYAVMKVPMENHKSIIHSFKIEKEILQYLDGAGGAPRLLASCNDPIAIIMEFCPGKTFWDCICDNEVSTDSIFQTFPEIAKQLQEIHSKGIIHVDIKIDNVLVDIPDEGKKPKINIIDFGMSCQVGTHIVMKVGKYSSYPPEYREGLATPAGDVYSFGVLMQDAIKYRRSICHIPKEFEVLAYSATEINPYMRPTLDHLTIRLNEAVANMRRRKNLRLVSAEQTQMNLDSECDKEKQSTFDLNERLTEIVSAALRRETILEDEACMARQEKSFYRKLYGVLRHNI
ncbi:hypothetical protein SK128_013847 [Halocaridina rubra]|uniref:Protein kinase domain-containing protein n=1 Tax=Halocaridina rubra TaxID=373956 RepID=A0AAN8WA40_HALRR